MQDNASVCHCETVSHGDLGPVVAGERLGRLVFSEKKNRWIKEGRVTPMFFSRRDICGLGVSMLRLDRMTADELKTLMPKIVATNPKSQLWGMVVAGVDQLRQIADALTCQSLCVADDPIKDDPQGAPDNPWHAAGKGSSLTLAIISPENPDDELIRIQTLMSRAFGQVLEDPSKAYAT